METYEPIIGWKSHALIQSISKDEISHVNETIKVLGKENLESSIAQHDSIAKYYVEATNISILS